MTKHDVIGVAICLASMAAFASGDDASYGWYFLWGSIFLISLLGLALYGRPTDPTSLSWDIGMRDDRPPTGTPEHTGKEPEREDPGMYRIAHQF